MEESPKQNDVSQASPERPKQSPKRSIDKKFLLIGLAVALVLVVGIMVANKNETSKTSTDTVVVAPALVSITAEGFSPATIKIQKGQSVTWTNQDTQSHQIASDPHPSHDVLPALTADTPLLANESYNFTFEEVGTFTYHDELRPFDIKGTVIVE